MANIVHGGSVNGESFVIRDINADKIETVLGGYYTGVDLTQAFAGEISASPYNGNPWAWIKARIQAGNFVGIFVGDWIPFTVTVSSTTSTYQAQIAGINTYKGYGDSGYTVPNHIDFITRELWVNRLPFNVTNYNNGIKEIDGNPAVESPWLASLLYHWINSLSGYVPSSITAGGNPISVNYTQDGVYYYLPLELKNAIVQKRMLLPSRFNASQIISSDASFAWGNAGNLWVPSEWEVIGGSAWAGANGYSTAGTAIQYPIFQSYANRRKTRENTADSWWTLSGRGDVGTQVVTVSVSGSCNTENANASTVSFPICFRIA